MSWYVGMSWFVGFDRICWVRVINALQGGFVALSLKEADVAGGVAHLLNDTIAG